MQYEKEVAEAKRALDNKDVMSISKKLELVNLIENVSREEWTHIKQLEFIEELYKKHGLRHDNYQSPANMRKIKKGLPSMISVDDNKITPMPNLINRDLATMYKESNEHKDKLRALYQRLVIKNRILEHRKEMKI